MCDVLAAVAPAYCVREYLKNGVRADGRVAEELRHVKLVPKVLPETCGLVASCIAQLGSTKFLVSCRAKILDDVSAPVVSVSAEFPASCGGRKTNAEKDWLCQQTEQVLTSAEIVDRSVGLIGTKHAWQLQFHAICLEYNGNPLDVCFLGIAACLLTGSVPSVAFVESTQSWQESAQPGDSEFQKATPLRAFLRHPESPPLASTFAIFPDGPTWVSDPTELEERVTDSLSVINGTPDEWSLVTVGVSSLRQEDCFSLIQRSSMHVSSLRKSLEDTADNAPERTSHIDLCKNL